MPQYLSNDLAGTTTGLTQAAAVPVGYKPRATVYGARLKRLRSTVTLAGQLTTDTLLLGNLPAGAVFAYGMLTSSASLGSSTLAIGYAGTTGAYRAAATFTSTDTPTPFGVTATGPAASDAGTSTETPVIGTIGAATLPSSGTLVVDLYYSIPN
jgi:hypothetical protein